MSAAHKTAAELVAAFDRGESVWSIEMGGLGPGYEQALQVLAIEIARAALDFKPSGDAEKDRSDFEAIAERAARSADAGNSLGGISGAQFSAARWLAWNWIANGGPEALLDRAQQHGEADRKILVDKTWPRAAAQTP